MKKTLLKKTLFSMFVPLALMQQPALAQGTEGAVVPLPRTDQVQLQLVNCSGWWLISPLDCGLSRLFLPASAFTTERQLQFDNTTSNAVNIMNTAVVAEGVETGYQLTNAVSISKSHANSGILSLPAREIGTLPLKLQPSAMPPDLYTGAIYITPESDGERFVLPLNIRVRSGALIPLLLLILGIILGQFFKYWQEQGEPQTQALEKIYRLRKDIQKVEDSEDRKLLAKMEKVAAGLVYESKLEAAAAEINLIYNRLELLRQLRIIEESLQRTDQLLARDDIEIQLEEITEARELIRQGTETSDAKAKELLETISNALGGIKAKGRAAGGDLADENHINALEATNNAKAILEKNSQISSISTAPLSYRERFQRFLVDLFGFSAIVRAEANYWVVRPFLWLTLLVFLSIVGMMNLYVENGATFGAKGFTDYFALILWGLSSNVASSSISNLPALRGQKGIEPSES